MMSEADKLIRRLYDLGDEADKAPGTLGAIARTLAEDLEEYFILYGRPDSRGPGGGVIDVQQRPATAADRKRWARDTKEIRRRNHNRDVLQGILDDTNAPAGEAATTEDTET